MFYFQLSVPSVQQPSSSGHCFRSSLKFPFKWCLNFKLFSLQAGLQRFTGIMGTTTSQQARGKGPIIGSVRKTLLIIKFCLRFMNPVQWAWLGCLSVMGNLIIAIFKWNLFQNRHSSAGPFIEIFGLLNNGWLLVNYWGGEAGLIIGMSSHVIPIFFTSVLWKSQVRREQKQESSCRLWTFKWNKYFLISE